MPSACAKTCSQSASRCGQRKSADSACACGRSAEVIGLSTTPSVVGAFSGASDIGISLYVATGIRSILDDIAAPHQTGWRFRRNSQASPARHPLPAICCGGTPAYEHKCRGGLPSIDRPSRSLPHAASTSMQPIAMRASGRPPHKRLCTASSKHASCPSTRDGDLMAAQSGMRTQRASRTCATASRRRAKVHVRTCAGQTARHAVAATTNRSFGFDGTSFPYIRHAAACCNQSVMSLSQLPSLPSL